MITLLPCLLTAVSLAADPVNPFREADESELFRFEEQLVTVASKYAQTVRKAPSIVSVVTADEIRERGYRTVSDILRDLPGIYMWQSVEGRDNASFRGVISPDNNKILVLIDGQPWYDGVYTHAFTGDYLPVSNIAQVEVIKGPGSAIYGTNAFAGVVNIVTFGPSSLQGGQVRWTVGASGRSDLLSTVGGEGKVGRFDTSVTAYARLLSKVGQGLMVTPEGAIDIPNNDPKRSVNVGTSLSVAGLRVQLHHVDYQHTYKFNERESPFDALARTLDSFDLSYKNTMFDVRYIIEPSRDLSITPYYWAQRYDNASSYFYGGSISVDPDTLEASQFFVTVDAEKVSRRWGTGLDVQVRPGLDHKAVGGVGVENVAVPRLFDLAFPNGGDPYVKNGYGVIDECGQVAGLYSNPKTCAPPRLRNLFAYAQYTWTAAPSVELTGGARVDKRIPMNNGDNKEDGVFAMSISPRLGVLLVPSDRITAKLLYGRAFRAPNARELLVRAEKDAEGYYEFTTGNLNLQPEAIHTFEGEVSTKLSDHLKLRADSSYSTLVNEIDKVSPGIYCNLTQGLKIIGGELGAKAHAGPADLDLSYALTLANYGDHTQLAQDACGFKWSDPYSGRQQYEFPAHMGKGRLKLAFTDDLSATLLGELYSARPRTDWSPDAGVPDGAPFALLHLGARFKNLGPGGRSEVGVSVRNLTNSPWNYGVYRDDANDTDYVNPVMGEGRTVLVNLETAF